MERFNGYIATQTEKGFHVVFHDSFKTPIEVTFNDFQEFANKYNQELTSGRVPELSEDEEVMLSIWQMMLIPDQTIH
ncbi:MAG TPA: hypothetical protein VHT73_07325 [Thermodesulfobacteriota bacterium]|nr:hypothetical protein [Thermodesulfobacteriota bacterium]